MKNIALFRSYRKKGKKNQHFIQGILWMYCKRYIIQKHVLGVIKGIFNVSGYSIIVVLYQWKVVGIDPDDA